jgi:hypothetical protein
MMGRQSCCFLGRACRIYATQDDYRWICDQCYEDFHEWFQWKVLQVADADD